jgi:HEAT repeat protein
MKARSTVSQRIDALAALDPSEGHDCGPQISKALKDRSPSIRTNAVQLIKLHSLISLLPQVEARLDDSSWMVRTEAAVCIGEILEPNGTPHSGLRKLLKDPNWVVRIDAMESLAMLEDLGSMPQIAKLLEDENGIVRSYAAKNLAEKCGHAYKPKISKLLQSENDPHARVGFLAAMYRMGDRNLLPQLLAFLKSEIYQIRCSVIHSVEDLPLSEVERATVIKTLLKLRRNEPTIAVKSTITTALKTLRNPT